jgi:Bacterial PH domain
LILNKASTYEVGLGTHRVLGFVIILLCTLAIVGALFGHQYGAAGGFFVFVMFGFLLIATGGAILIGETDIEHSNFFGRFRIDWSDVRRIEVGNAGTLILHGDDRRFALIPPGFRSGSQKPEAVAMLQRKLKALEVEVFRTSVGDYKIHKNVRVVDR